MDRGREPLIVLQNLAGFYRDLLIAKTAGDRHDLVAITPPTWADMQTLVQDLDPTVLLLGQQHLRSAEVQVKNTTQPRLWLEVTLLGMLPSAIVGQLTKQLHSGSENVYVRKQANELSAPPDSIKPSKLSRQDDDQRTEPSQLKKTEDFNSNKSEERAISRKSEDRDIDSETAKTNSFNESDIGSQDASIYRESEDKKLIWERFLVLIESPATGELLKQQGRLLDFDGETSRIGIASRWYPSTKDTRLDFIQKAFEKAVGKKVRVVLEPISLDKKVSFSRRSDASEHENESSHSDGRTDVLSEEGSSNNDTDHSALTNPQSQNSSEFNRASTGFPFNPGENESSLKTGSHEREPLYSQGSEVEEAVKRFTGGVFHDSVVVEIDEEYQKILESILDEGKENSSRQNPRNSNNPF
jgi:DNA polymerase-3 subunit gamma/tau